MIPPALPVMVRREPRKNALNAAMPAAPVVAAGSVKFGNDLPISIIAGPCQLESRAHALEVATALKEIAARLKIGIVYKTSFDKANRTSVSAARGIGLKQALPIFAEIRASLGMPVLTDVHEASQCAEVAQAVDVLQIPAFLCRQTDLLVAAAANRRSVCRHRKAGICSTSTACATSAHCETSWTSVSTGMPSDARISAKIGSAALSPIPRLADPEVRLALSKEDLKTRPIARRAAISLSA